MNRASLDYAIVFNCDYNGLGLIQSLGRRGVPVIAADTRRAIGTFSRYSRFRRIVDPFGDEKAFVASLMEIQREIGGRPLLLPTNDEFVEAVARNFNTLNGVFRIATSDSAAVDLILDKYRFGKWIEGLGINTPTVWRVEEALESTIEFPVALKTNGRRRLHRGEARGERARVAEFLRFRKCESRKELADLWAVAQSAGVDVLCQQLILGRSDAMRTVGVYASNGEVLATLFGRKVRGYPAQYGDCVVGSAEPVPSWVRPIVERVCKDLKYTGIAEFEFIEDIATKRFYLLEINPRSWSWVGVGPAAGVDLAWIAYQDLVLGERPGASVNSCIDGAEVVYAKVLSDFQNVLLWYRLSGAKDWASGPLNWWQFFRHRNTVFAEFSRDDPGISFIAVLFSLRAAAAELRRLIQRT